jgi:hypothetical protein
LDSGVEEYGQEDACGVTDALENKAQYPLSTYPLLPPSQVDATKNDHTCPSMAFKLT